jgi:uroporphyrinogen-III synthase
MTQEVRVAVFRPDDGRLADAVALAESLGATPVADPMLAIDPTGDHPRNADYVILTSTTGVDILADAGWDPGDAVLCCIGETTAAAARDAGWTVDRIPEDYSSAGMVAELRAEVGGKTVEVARSAHGSATLVDGLRNAGADVHEAQLYRLVRPPDAGVSAEMAAAGELEAVAFTSSRTIDHFVAAAEERGVRDAAIRGLADAVVGVIADGPRTTAEGYGIGVDVVPAVADFDALLAEVVERAAPTYHE